MATRRLYIKTIDANGEVKPFPFGGVQAELTSYTYSASRMGGAPSLSGTVNYPRCLDADWTRKEFVEYEGERYLVEQIPSSSKDNSTCMFKHTLELYSARYILDNVFFFDAVKNDSGDVYRSNMTSFTFGGTIEEFKDRLNASLDYCSLYDEEGVNGYCVVIDGGLSDGTIKELSFEDKYITEAIQEVYNTFELPYYWVGKICHIGWAENILTTPLKYGHKEALLSVQKENANNAIIDAITGHGGSDNIDYYYPNDNPYGYAIFETENFDSSYVDEIDLEKVFDWTFFNDVITLCKTDKESYSADVNTNVPYSTRITRSLQVKPQGFPEDFKPITEGLEATVWIGKVFTSYNASAFATFSIVKRDVYEVKGKKVEGQISFPDFGYEAIVEKSYRQINAYDGETEELEDVIDYGFTYDYKFYFCENMTCKEVVDYWDAKDVEGSFKGESRGPNPPGAEEYKISDTIPFIVDKPHAIIVVTTITAMKGDDTCFSRVRLERRGRLDYTFTPKSRYTFSTAKRDSKDYGSSGITLLQIDTLPAKETSYKFDNGEWVFETVTDGSQAARITITGREWITPSQHLMPSVYRESYGAERFLYALDNTHLLPDSTDEYYTFTNQYVKGNPHQGSVSFDDIKPTIKGMTNEAGELFGEVADVAYDKDDNDTVDDNGNYTHQYFYIKLHKFSGDGGFNLFQQLLGTDNMTLDMIDCQGCPACSFPVKAVTSDNNTFYNCVSTDGNGNLVAISGKEADDYVLSTSEAMSDTLNQDTTKKEIWICVQKDASTLGIVMPNAAANLKVKKGDQFVITGISLPRSYTIAAEKRLDAALVKNMKENNEEKFKFSVKFSRIFLAENPSFANSLNENARVIVEYCNEQRVLYVSSYTAKTDGNVLDEVSVELTDELSTAQSTILQRISGIKGDMLDSVTKMLKTADLINIASKFLFKDRADTALGRITFASGLTSKGTTALEQGMTVGTAGVYGMDNGGNVKAADLEAVTGKIISAVIDSLQSSDYDTTEQTGFGFYRKTGGRYGLNITDLMVWGKAIFNSLEIRKLYSVGGNIVLSPAASKLFKVAPYYETASDGTRTQTGWQCWLLADDGTMATTNQWQIDDQARCQTFDIAEGTYENVSNKNYWRRVTAVSTENEHILDETTGTALYDGQKFAWIVLSKDDCLDGSDEPQAEDTIVCMGNRNSTGDSADRANLIMLETTGEDAPLIALYRHVYGYSLQDTCVFKLSYNGVDVVSKYFNYVSSSGEKEWRAVYLGDWVSTRIYHYYEEVTHNGTRWLCIAPADGEGTQSEPSETNDLWHATTAIQREKLMLELNGQDTLDWGESITVTAAVYLGDNAVDTSSGWEWSVTRDSGDATEDAAWNAASKAQQFKGTIILSFSESCNDLGAEVAGVYGTVFTFNAWRTGEKAAAVSATLAV